MKKVLWVSDGVVPTGFGRVAHSIINRIKGLFDITHVAINYHGQKHDLDWEVLPAISGGDIWGVGVLKDIVKSREFDIIVLFNDLYVIDMYLRALKESISPKKRPKVVVYFPVDSMYLNRDWFVLYPDYVDVVFTYTEWGLSQVRMAADDIINNKYVEIVSHGIDKDVFRKIDKRAAVENLFSNQSENVRDEIYNAVVFFNANRNQPRKRIDLAIAGFAEFVYQLDLTPKDVKLYLHMGLIDAGWNIPKLISLFGIQEYVIFTSTSKAHPMVDDETLNYIYNVGDIGVNTSEGEGFGLIPVEHSILGKPQVLSNNSVIPELFGDDAYLIDCPVPSWSIPFTTLFMAPTQATVAEAMKRAYIDYITGKSKVASHRFNDKKFDWDYIAGQFKRVME